MIDSRALPAFWISDLLQLPVSVLTFCRVRVSLTASFDGLASAGAARRCGERQAARWQPVEELSKGVFLCATGSASARIPGVFAHWRSR